MRLLFSENIDEIPSESSILAAKEKRDRLRKTKVVNSGAEEDFISLSVLRKEDVYQGPHPESRLMREDDDLGEGDDGKSILSMPVSQALLISNQNLPSIRVRKKELR